MCIFNPKQVRIQYLKYRGNLIIGLIVCYVIILGGNKGKPEIYCVYQPTKSTLPTIIGRALKEIQIHEPLRCY